MQIKKRLANDIPREDAHGGSGGRRLFASKGDLGASTFEAATYGYLPAGQTFDWHHHDDIDEFMIVLRGTGEVSDRDGTYKYAAGDFFIFPANIEHRIHNPTDEEHEYVFVRISRS